jgi:peptidoglycan hydrolase CwlO-like protein
MQLWHKLLISSGAVLICLISGALMTEPLSSIPSRFTLEATTSADVHSMTLKQAQQQAQTLALQIHTLRQQEEVERKAAESAVRFLYEYHSAGAGSFVQSVVFSQSFHDAVSNVAALSSVLRHDDEVLRRLQQTEHLLAVKEQEASADGQHLKQISLQQGGEQTGALLTSVMDQ